MSFSFYNFYFCLYSFFLYLVLVMSDFSLSSNYVFSILLRPYIYGSDGFTFVIYAITAKKKKWKCTQLLVTFFVLGLNRQRFLRKVRAAFEYCLDVTWTKDLLNPFRHTLDVREIYRGSFRSLLLLRFFSLCRWKLMLCLQESCYSEGYFESDHFLIFLSSHFMLCCRHWSIPLFTLYGWWET